MFKTFGKLIVLICDYNKKNVIGALLFLKKTHHWIFETEECVYSRKRQCTKFSLVNGKMILPVSIIVLSVR